MSTQYDTIQRPYDEIRKTSIALIERENVHDAIAPFIKGARVLDLACGTGFYSHEFAKWGASSVVGVDISTAMLAEATRALESANTKSKVDFIQADCMKPLVYEGGGFQIVFGAWLLNYAASAEDLTELFRNISLNLEDGGHFIGVTPVPTQDPVAFYDAENRVRPHGSGLLISQPTGEVKDGITLHLHADTAQGAVDFDCYHLQRHIYEAAAKAGGLNGELKWILTTVPDAFLENDIGGASPEELESYKVTPNYSVLVIAK